MQARSLLAGSLRLGLGARVGAVGRRPTAPLVLYDFEACPYCRKVREAISMLDLVVDVRPCPKAGIRFRPELGKLAGRMRVPTLLDEGAPGGRRVLQESEVIVAHLFSTYGTGRPPRRARLGTVGTWTSGLVSGARLHRGKWARASKERETKYELWSFEASAESASVRELLTELEVPYRLMSCAEGGTRRSEVAVVPTLRDESRGLDLAGADAIRAHLEKEHAA